MDKVSTFHRMIKPNKVPNYDLSQREWRIINENTKIRPSFANFPNRFHAAARNGSWPK